MQTQSRRERLRETTYQEIKDLARKQMYEGGGVAAVSLRGVAGSMGMTAPAIYRYFPTRDDLITALIVDAYTSIGDAIIEAVSKQRDENYGNRFYLAAMAYRDWALSHPAEFDLIFGRPLPGYQAPAEVTVPLVQRAFSTFLVILQQAWEQGLLKLPEIYTNPSSELQDYLQDWLKRTGDALAAPVVHFGLAKWGQMHGTVGLELNGQLHPMMGEGVTALYQTEIRGLLESAGLTVTL
jgi:AcrR family transcriptional regulator